MGDLNLNHPRVDDFAAALRAERAADALRAVQRIGRLSRHPKHLRARWLHLAAGSRKAATEGAHPGRGWWLRQHRDCMRKAQEQR